MARMGRYKDNARVVGWRLSPELIRQVKEMAEAREWYEIEVVREMIKIHYKVFLDREAKKAAKSSE